MEKKTKKAIKAIKRIKKFCKSRDAEKCLEECPLYPWCNQISDQISDKDRAPEFWDLRGLK